MAKNRVRKLYLDSALSEEGGGCDITFQLPFGVATQKGDALALTSMSFPNVFATVTAGYNDRLYYATLAHEDDTSVTYRCCYKLLPGSYSGDTFAAEVQRCLTLSTKGDQNPSVTFNSATGRMHVQVSDETYEIPDPERGAAQGPGVPGCLLAGPGERGAEERARQSPAQSKQSAGGRIRR
jgi:hypothetical protein